VSPGARNGAARGAPVRNVAAPILVRQIRNGIVESVHRGDVVEVDVSGRLIRAIGNPDRLVTLRSCVKPFGLLALVEAGGIEAFDLSPAELAIMASSHSGEDIHVRTLQGIFRRANISQTVLACGNEGMPLDALTAARLARDGEKAGPIRHMCSGQHSSMILLARLNGWALEDYWQPEHPSQGAYRAAVAGAFRTTPGRLVRAIDGCGIETYAFPLAEVARACEVNPNVLHRWRREFRHGPGNVFPGNGKQRWSEGRIAELERKVGQQTLEIDFLKGCLQRIEEQRMLQALSGSPRSTGRSKKK